MTDGALLIDLHLPELDAPKLDLGSAIEPEGLLFRLQSQNSALERLRHALDVECEWIRAEERQAVQPVLKCG